MQNKHSREVMTFHRKKSKSVKNTGKKFHYFKVMNKTKCSKWSENQLGPVFMTEKLKYNLGY